MYTPTVFIAAAILLANSVSSAPAPKDAAYNGTITSINTTSGIAHPTGTVFVSTIHSATTTPSVTPVIPKFPVTSTTAIGSASTAPSASVSVIASGGTPIAGTHTVAATPATTTTPSGLTLFQQLVLAPNAVERQALLQDGDFIFDFTDPNRVAGVTKGDGGKIVRADHATFPALVGQGGAVAIGFLGPCGFNTPHVHPRAAELNLVVQGRLFASVTAENGARHLNHTLNQYSMTVFPQGAVHTEFNPDCTDAVFVASFPSEDPGVGQIAQEFYGLEDEIVKGSTGGELNVNGADIDAFRLLIPANVAKGVDSCLAKCGIAKR
jgi:hypothetical protein